MHNLVGGGVVRTYDLANILRDLELCPWAKRDIDVHYKREERNLSEFTFDLQKRSDP